MYICKILTLMVLSGHLSKFCHTYSYKVVLAVSIGLKVDFIMPPWVHGEPLSFLRDCRLFFVAFKVRFAVNKHLDAIFCFVT